jgi:hypothetical protein
MATFQSLQMSAPRYPVSGPGIGGRSLKVERAVVDLATIDGGNARALASGDVVELFKLHPKFRVRSAFVKVEAAAGASVTYTVGDTGGGGAAADPARYFASASAAAVGSNVTMADTGRDFLTSPNTPGGKGRYTTVTLTVGGATTNTTGRIIVVIDGYIEEPA